MPDGRIARFEVPEGTTPEQAQAMMAAQVAEMPQEPPNPFSLNPKRVGQMKQAVGDTLAGALRGAGSIGATILSPLDAAARAAGVENDWIGRTDRRQAMDEGLRAMGADPESMLYQGGKMWTEIAGTAGVGGALARGVGALSQAPRVVQLAEALRTGGMGAGSMPMRVAGGAAGGAAMAGAVNPEDALSGAVMGGAIPVAGAALKSGARSLMQSAIKPTIEQLRKGKARVAVDTLLDYGLSPSERGVDRLRGVIDDLNTQISDKIAGSRATIPQRDVLNYLADVNRKFAGQVSPTSDLASIQNVADDFMAHPAIRGRTIPIKQAQALKQGTYKALKGKYGEVGSAATEAQKALARGLKEKIGQAVPEVVPLNLEEQRLLDTLEVAERRALVELNKNPLGLASLAGNPTGFAAFMADKSAAFKALMARMANRTSESMQNPAVRAGVVGTQSD
jgi:hypothetical protein